MKNLSIADFCLPTFDIQKPTERKVRMNDQEILAIEGSTFTNQLHKVGFTYVQATGMMHLHYYDMRRNKDIMILRQRVSSTEEFEAALKKADKKIAQYNN